MKTTPALYDALIEAKVPREMALRVVNALEDDMQDKLATKQDLNLLRQEISSTLYRALLIQTLTLAGLMVALVNLM